MTRWIGQVTVTLKSSVNDPQGLAVLDGLHTLGFSNVSQVRVGKHIDIDLDAPDEARARQLLDAMCERLLANTLIENYSIELSQEAGE